MLMVIPKDIAHLSLFALGICNLDVRYFFILLSIQLCIFFRYYKKESSVVDITVEDPSDNFVRLRDFVDTQNCMKLDAYAKVNF